MDDEMTLGSKVKVNTGKKGPRPTGTIIGADEVTKTIRVRFKGGTEGDFKVDKLTKVV